MMYCILPFIGVCDKRQIGSTQHAGNNNSAGANSAPFSLN